MSTEIKADSVCGREPGIPSALTALEKACVNLKDAAEALRGRMTPVLIPEPVAPDPEDCENRGDACPVTNSIERHVRQISMIIDIIRNLTGRVDL